MAHYITLKYSRTLSLSLSLSHCHIFARSIKQAVIPPASTSNEPIIIIITTPLLFSSLFFFLSLQLSMSINHYAPEARLYWSQQQQPATWLENSHTPRFNLNDNQEEVEEEEEEVAAAAAEKGGGGGAAEEEEKEAMFEKPLTPSDVGKLNRLVIPKQHAEKHFPLESSSSSSCGDSAKGVLLSFEDEVGKCWRFRYSYWNSSQSYVLTKGWSRYVKDKRLHAGDVVFFHRHRSHPQRFFISSTRRQANPPAHVTSTATPSFYSAHPYPAHHLPFPYQPQSLHAAPGTSWSVCFIYCGLNYSFIGGKKCCLRREVGVCRVRSTLVKVVKNRIGVVN